MLVYKHTNTGQRLEFTTKERTELNIKSSYTTECGIDVETVGGTIIHVFNTLPTMRKIEVNKIWFKSTIYTLK